MKPAFAEIFGDGAPEQSPRTNLSLMPPENVIDMSIESRSSRFSDVSSDELVPAQKPRKINSGIRAWLRKRLEWHSLTDNSCHTCFRKRKRRCGRSVLLIFLTGLLLTIFPLLLFTTIRLSQLGLHPALSALLSHWGEAGSVSALLAHYPTDFTRDITPVPIHSYNDYWRRVPLFDAIAIGATGVEADIWLEKTKNGSTDLLYIEPLTQVLERQNPSTELANTTRNGIFDTDPSQSMVLLIDLKSDPVLQWPVMMQQPQPFRDRRWLTYYNETPNSLFRGPITIVVTGNATFSQVTSPSLSPHRDIFFDAPLDSLDDSGQTTPYSWKNSVYASVNFDDAFGKLKYEQFSLHQLDTLRAQVQSAEEKGLRARCWNTPAWPVRRRDHVWDVLMTEGVGMLGVDALGAAKSRNWKAETVYY